MHVDRARRLQNGRHCAVEEGSRLRQPRPIRITVHECLHAPPKHRNVLEIFDAFAHGFGMLRQRNLAVGEKEWTVRCLRRGILVPGMAARIVSERPEKGARRAHLGARPRLQALIGVRVGQPGRTVGAVDRKLLALFATVPIEIGEGGCRIALPNCLCLQLGG